MAVFFTQPVWGATYDLPGARVVTAQYLDQAKALLGSGKAEEAWRMLSNLVREEPDNVEVNVLLSQAAFATGRDNQALTAMERLVEIYPENAGLRLSLARAYARAGDEAAFAAEMAEARRLKPDISEDDEASLEKLASSSAHRYDRFKSAGRLALGLLWDSNATTGLDSLEVDVGGYTFRLNDNAKKRPSTGEYATGQLNWGLQLGDETPWSLTGDFAFYGKTFNTDLPANQQFTWAHAALGLRHVSERHMFEVRGHLENASYDPFESITSRGGDATFVYALLPSLQLIAHGSLDSRLYMQVDGKDGLYWSAGGYARYMFGANRHTATAGIKAIGAMAEKEWYSYDGFETSLRFDIEIMPRLNFSPFFAWRQSVYHEAATRLSKYLGEDNRWDNLLMAGCGFTYHWTENVATEVGWQYLNNNSNSAFYRYDQHQINMGMVFSF